MAEINEGMTAPDFSAVDQDKKRIDMAEFIGQRNVVLYFYPKDDTPGCTLEAKEFSEIRPEFERIGTEVLGISVDDAESHKAFCDKYAIAFRLVADPQKTISEKYGVLSEKGYSRRVTFVVDKGGVVRKVYPKVDPIGHAAQVLADVKALDLE